jgi:uncharacterized damage-inducible protein DinB
MIGREMLATLYAHSTWATTKILDCAAKLTDEQWNQPSDFVQRSLHEILFHSMGAEIAWRMTCEEGARPTHRAQITDFPTVESLRVRWEQQQADVQRFIASLSDDALASPFEVRNADGSVFNMVRWHMLMSAVLHNIQHRAEAAAILTQLGHSPGDLDLVFFVR